MNDIDKRFLAALQDLRSLDMTDEAAAILHVFEELADFIASAGDLGPMALSAVVWPIR